MPNGTQTFQRLTKTFETIFLKISVPFDSVPEFPKILAQWITPLFTPLHEKTWLNLSDVKYTQPPIYMSLNNVYEYLLLNVLLSTASLFI